MKASFIKEPINLIKNKFSSQFVRNIGWMGISELIPRVVRLGVTVILARYLSSVDYGLGAIIMTVVEFMRVFMDVGITPKIMQADEEKLEELCNSAYWLNWLIFISLFFIQCAIAFPVAWFYNHNELILPICVAGLAYLSWPIVTIKYARIQRENKLKIVAINNSIQNSVLFVSSAVLAVLGMGIWSFVLPSLIVSPIVVYIYYTNHPWKPTQGLNSKYWGEIWTFGKNILGISLLRTVRNNLDYMIVGRFLGVEELGIYYFGFNAGLGISMSAINSLNAAVFANLCAARATWDEFKQRYFKSLKTVAFIIIPLVLLQSGLAPFYVPIVFGQKWIVAIPILILVCLSAIPRAFADTATQMLVAAGKPDLDLRWNLIFTMIFALALLMGVNGQALGVAMSVFLVHLIFLPLFAVWATGYMFRRGLVS